MILKEMGIQVEARVDLLLLRLLREFLVIAVTIKRRVRSMITMTFLWLDGLPSLSDIPKTWSRFLRRFFTSHALLLTSPWRGKQGCSVFLNPMPCELQVQWSACAFPEMERWEFT